jgi:hypothetical protein
VNAASIIGVGYVIALAAGLCCWSRIARRRTGLDQTDPRRGTDKALADECALIYAMPEFQRATDRLLDDIHNAQGDQQ